MTYQEAAVISVYTGVTLLAGDNLKYLYYYASDLLERPAQTLDFLTHADELREKSKPDFIKICKSLTPGEVRPALSLRTCPVCHKEDGFVYDSRTLPDNTILRRRKCPHCGKIWKTREIPF